MLENKNNEEKILNVLKIFGLNSYERQAYALLLRQGSATSSQITEHTTIPRARTYDVLKSLETKGFTKILYTKPRKFVSLHPIDMLENLKKNLETEYKNKLNSINDFSHSNELRILSDTYDAKAIEEDINVNFNSIKDKSDFEKTFKSIINNSEKEISIITTETGMANIANYFQALKTAALKGIKIRIIAPITDKNISHAKKMAEVGVIKNINSSDKIKSNGTMILMDEKETIISISDENKFSVNSPLLWMQSDHFSKTFARTNFDLMWNHLEDIDKLSDN